MLQKIRVPILQMAHTPKHCFKKALFFVIYFCILNNIFFLVSKYITVKSTQVFKKKNSTYTLSFERPTLNILNIMHSPTMELPHSQTDCT